MKKPLLLVALLAAAVYFFSCQKELSLETGSSPSKGSLQSDLTGDCMPKTVNGIYEAGKALVGTTNYIDVTVNVATAGSYTIYTDTVNGVWFRATGVFTTTGVSTVRLKGNGTPVNAGINNYVVTYDASICAVAITTVPAGGAVPAVMTLAGAPGSCTDATSSVSGNYIVGTALTPANTVVIKVNVTTAGTYTITTVVSNGIVFSGSGTVAAGAQTITLAGSGTPVSAGPTNVPVTVGSSNCSFTVTVTSTAPPPGDYYPRTVNSNWSYEFDGNPNDSILIKVINNTINVGGNTLQVFMGTDNAANGFDSAGYFRKSGGNYYRFEDLSNYLFLDDEQRAEFIFLKDDQPANTKWETATYVGAVSGQALQVKIEFTILQKDVNVTVKGTNYPNTIVVQEKYFVGPVGAPPAAMTDATSIFGYFKDYYSKGVGWIMDEYFDPTNAPNGKLELRRHAVY